MISFKNSPNGLIGQSDLSDSTCVIFFNRSDPRKQHGVIITGSFTFEEFLVIAEKVKFVETTYLEDNLPDDYEVN